MNNSVNITAPQASTNSTTQSIGPMKSLEICVYSINFLFGLPTHSYVIWLIITGTGSGVASEFFNLNLSICEIGNCLNGLLLVLLIWFSGLLTLKVLITGLAVTGRPLFQCLVCVERYLAVVHPVTFLKFKPLRYRVICCTVAWIITLSSCLCSMFILTSFNFLCTYMVHLAAVPPLLLHPVVLLCGCSQSSEALRTRREKRGKQHEEKSILSHSYNNSKHGHHICADYYFSIIYQCDKTLYSGSLGSFSDLFWADWFCSPCSLFATYGKTAQSHPKLSCLCLP